MDNYKRNNFKSPNYAFYYSIIRQDKEKFSIRQVIDNLASGCCCCWIYDIQILVLFGVEYEINFKNMCTSCI